MSTRRSRDPEEMRRWVYSKRAPNRCLVFEQFHRRPGSTISDVAAAINRPRSRVSEVMREPDFRALLEQTNPSCNYRKRYCLSDLGLDVALGISTHPTKEQKQLIATLSKMAEVFEAENGFKVAPAAWEKLLTIKADLEEIANLAQK